MNFANLYHKPFENVARWGRTGDTISEEFVNPYHRLPQWGPLQKSFNPQTANPFEYRPRWGNTLATKWEPKSLYRTGFA